MSGITDPNRRTAGAPDRPHSGPITLINSFQVAEGREQAFLDLWTETSSFFRRQPGFISLRLHRALSPQAAYRYVNVAVWASAELFAAAHAMDTFKQLVSQPAWKEFPSSPALYEIATEFRAESSAA